MPSSWSVSCCSNENLEYELRHLHCCILRYLLVICILILSFGKFDGFLSCAQHCSNSLSPTASFLWVNSHTSSDSFFVFFLLLTKLFHLALSLRLGFLCHRLHPFQ